MDRNNIVVSAATTIAAVPVTFSGHRSSVNVTRSYHEPSGPARSSDAFNNWELHGQRMAGHRRRFGLDAPSHSAKTALAAMRRRAVL